MEPRDDADLLRCYAHKHDEPAFAELVRRHVDGVYSAALRRVGGDVQLAEDVVQLVFVALARQARELERHPVLSAWLYLTTRNQAANVVRAEQRRKIREEEALAMESNSPEPANDLNWARVSPLLDGVIDQLTESDRRAVLLRFVDHRSYGEMAAALRVSEDAVRMRVDRALEKLRRLLARRGISSTTAALSVALTNQAVTAAPAGLAASVTGAAVVAAPLVGSAASLFQLMTATKTLVSVMGVLVLVSAGLSTREALHWRQTQAAFAVATQETERVAAQAHDAQTKMTTAEQQVRDLQAALADPATTKPAALAKPVAPVAASETRIPAAPLSADASRAAGRAFLARHPELKQAAIDYHHGIMREMFGAFYRQRGFTDAQIEAFENNMMAGAGVFRMTTDSDGQRIPISTPTFGDQAKRAEEERQLVALLGADGVPALRQYLQQVPAQKLTAQLAGTLSFTAAPLSADQAERFTAVVSEVGATGKPVNGRYNWDAIVARSQEVLTPAQRDALLALQARDEFELALSRAMQRNTPRPSPAAPNSRG
jgi:RNA polymerase sigma factor (sigma-70 family)